MIVMRLSDGLGNQLFQFATGETLRLRTGANICYLIDAFASRHARLDRLLLLPQLVDCEARLLAPTSLRSRAAQLMCRLLTPGLPVVRHVPHLCHLTRVSGYDPLFDRIDGDMLVSGYFQARQCVTEGLPSVREQVRARFGAAIRAAAVRIRAVHREQRIVAVHIRLGDYRRIGDGREAIVPVERIRSVLRHVDPAAVVLVFTDSPEILPELDLGRQVEAYRGTDALDDFAGMVACDDFVIANSTFSWWASVLGEAPGKTVWAPRDWMRPARAGGDSDNQIYLSEQRLY